MLIAPTVLGQEVSASNSSTETSATAATTTPSAGTGTSTGEAAGSGARSEATVATATTTNGGTQSTTAVAEATPQLQTQTPPAATSTSSASSTSSSEDKAPKAASTTSSSATVASPSNGSNQGAGTEAAPQMMDVEKYTVDKESSELNIKDGETPKNRSSVTKDTKLIRNRDGKQRDIVDVTRTVKTNEDGTIDVTVTVKPKQIDEGADVMALLDVSKKMTQENFDKAKEQIKKMVTTLTSKTASGEQENHNRRNSVRLITFYRKVNEPIELTAENVEAKLKEVWEQAKKDWDWGVDLQGAIHKAREIFNKEKEKNSGKRQHIVLFSQGESTFSYDINDKDKDNIVQKNRIAGKVTTSNPLFPWLPIFNHTHQKADMIDDVKYLIQLGEKLGIEGLSGLKDKLSFAGLASGLAGTIFGGGSLTEYLSLKEYQTDKLSANHFNYEKRVGEGYYYHSFSERKTSEMPNRSLIKQQLEGLFKDQEGSWFKSILETLSLTSDYQKAKEAALLKLLDYLFHKREYIYYNHNLSAIAEAQMAQQEGITFYSVDVTESNTAKRVKRQTATPINNNDKKKEIEEERHKKFDSYLKQMSEDGKEFFTGVDKADKFKDTLTELTIRDEFTNNVTVQDNSEGTKYKTNLTNGSPSVSYTPANQSSWFNSTKESLTWTISKDQLKKAFEEGKPLTLTYKLKVEKEKFKEALENHQKRKKRSKPTENENSVTKDIISNTITYKINKQKVEGNKLENVKLTYTKETVPVPDVEGTVEVPKVPEKPLVEPMTPLYPAIPNYPTPQLPKDEDLEISGGHGPIVDIVEDTGTGVEGGAQNGVVSTQENKDPIVDITEDTQPGMSDSNDATVVEEDTAPKRPDILVGGQSDPIDITEDTQPGMSGSNDATVIEEDTKPKRFFHFDNEPQAPEKPKEQPSLQDSNSLPQAPAYKAAHHLPASGDKREVYFTIAALTIIGAAGLLSKKRRDTEEN